jgi:hypothetical protein
MVAIDYTEKGDCFEKKNMGIILNCKYIRTHCKALRNLVTTRNELMALIHLPQLYCP